MKSYLLALLVMVPCCVAQAQTKEGDAKPFSLYNSNKTPLSDPLEARDVLKTSPTIPAIPPGTVDRFDEGLFTAKEQVHDVNISDLTSRVSILEGTSNWVRGAIWAIGIIAVAMFGFLSVFWRGLVKVILLEVQNPAKPSA